MGARAHSQFQSQHMTSSEKVTILLTEQERQVVWQVVVWTLESKLHQLSREFSKSLKSAKHSLERPVTPSRCSHTIINHDGPTPTCCLCNEQIPWSRGAQWCQSTTDVWHLVEQNGILRCHRSISDWKAGPVPMLDSESCDGVACVYCLATTSAGEEKPVGLEQVIQQVPGEDH